MVRPSVLRVLLIATTLAGGGAASAGQAPGAVSDPDIPVSHRDRVYSAERFSNTVSVTDPVDNKLLGVIRLGDPLPASFSPLYKGQLLVHGMGFSPDHRTLAVVAIGSNAVNFIDTATNAVKHITYVGRSPHEAFITMDGREVWVTVRGENYVAVLDGTTYEEKTRIVVANGPGMTIFSPDGKYGYVCSSFTPETDIITVADHKIVGKVRQASPFCPNIAATPDSSQVWFTLKDTGKVEVFDGQPPFALLKTLDTGPITNHVNLVRNANGMFAYVTVGGLDEIQVFRTDDFSKVATIPVGKLVQLGRVQSLGFGERDGKMSDRVHAIANVVRSCNFDGASSETVLQDMWEKWVFLGSSAASTSLMRAPIGMILAAPGGKDFLLGILDECRAVATAEGYPPRAPALERATGMLTTEGSPLTASMFRDIGVGQPVEADHVIGDLIARADTAKVPVPRLRTAYTHLKAYEQTRG